MSETERDARGDEDRARRMEDRERDDEDERMERESDRERKATRRTSYAVSPSRVLVTGMKRVRRRKSALYTRRWPRKENRSQAIFRRNFYWYARHVGRSGGAAAGVP